MSGQISGPNPNPLVPIPAAFPLGPVTLNQAFQPGLAGAMLSAPALANQMWKAAGNDLTTNQQLLAQWSSLLMPAPLAGP